MDQKVIGSKTSTLAHWTVKRKQLQRVLFQSFPKIMFQGDGNAVQASAKIP